MRAVHITGPGEQLQLADLPIPTPSANEVLLRVRAASLNPLDNHIAAGWLEGMFEHRYPLVVGRDASGVVESVGEGVTDVRVGDEVIAHILFEPPFEAGTLAEYALVPSRTVTPKPADLDHVTAAALPLAGGAARMLVDAIGSEAGQVVLINGASGGVGRYAVQLLSQQGVTVVATGTAADADRLREMGAELVIDFTLGDVAKQVLAVYPQGVDALINLTGYALEEVPVGAIRSGGVVRTTTQMPTDEIIVELGLTGGGIVASPTREVIEPLAQGAASGDLLVDVYKVLSLDEAIAGLSELAEGRAPGKLVVDFAR
ncbi:NADP-dependent oxidoreductase [Nocardioides houyundeii]|uniref:NADP-dependent oxidoreductase n=1 Tax=Nocardioides houyundeii TaxID=2045452 RepID=UPI000C7949BA|nr:NADP-dependent oxidoreductase [Nocardioides houyundeii]